MKRKVNVLWISSVAPYTKSPTAGGQTFNYYFKEFLKDERFAVSLIAWAGTADRETIEKENECVKHKILYASDNKTNVFSKLVNVDSRFNPYTKYAGLISNYCATQILKTAHLWKQQGYVPDIIILEWTNIVLLSKAVKQIFPRAKLIASEHDVTFIGYERKKHFYKGFAGLLWSCKYQNEKRKELEALHLADIVLPQNFDNRGALIECGINQEKIQWLIPFFNNMSCLERKPNGRDILFFGAMSRPENYLSAKWFIEHVMPKLEDQNIRFVILGGNPPDELRQYENDRVLCTGFVDDIKPYFRDAVCFVAPLVLGAGIKVKILEAMSSGVPVLTNCIGIEGVPATEGEEYLFCQTAADYETSIREILSGEIDTEHLKESARAFINGCYSLTDSLEQYKKRIINLVEEKV